MFGVSKKIKVTALYVAKAIYNAVIFMNAEQEFVIRDNFFRFPNLKQFVE